jgi:diaminopimelate decarboxylase
VPEPGAANRSLPDELLARHFAVEGGELVIGGQRASGLIERFGSPLFVYDAALIHERVRALRAALPPQFDLCYSMKANPNPAVVSLMVRQGLGIEIASAGELLRALAVGCPADRILFAGTGKTTAELQLAVSRGIGEIHLESLGEARRLADVSAAAGACTRVSLRVNPSAAVEGGGMRMGARSVAFGIDEDQLEDVVAAVMDSPSLELVGLHLFVGTQILDAGTLLRQYAEGLNIARRLSVRIGRPLDTVDLGGGLGIPYFPGEARLDLDALRSGLAELFVNITDDAAFRSTRFVLEPGRFLVGEAGVYLATVTDVKRSRDKGFVVTDGGMHHHLAASGNLGQTIKRNFPIVIANRVGEAATSTVDVVGPLCTPLDTIGRGVALPATEPGDIVAVLQSGAYGLSSSPAGFLSRPLPAEVLVDEQGHPHCARTAGRAEDYADLTGFSLGPVRG